MKYTESLSPGDHLASFLAASRITLGLTEVDGRPSSPYNSVHNLTSERLLVLGLVNNGAGGGGGGGTFVNVHFVFRLTSLPNNVI